MADYRNLTDTLLFESQSPAGSKDGEFDDNGYERSSVYYDTIVLDTPIDENETQLEKVCFDTEVVDNDDDDMGHMEDEKVEQALCELDTEIVLDSEDASKKREKQIPCLDADSFDKQLSAGKRGSSINPNSSDVKQDVPQLSIGDHENRRFEYVDDSQEPEESSEATALCFVDNFLSFNNVDMSQGVKERMMKKSPLVSSAKGTRRLAKIIKRGSPVKEMRTFEWIESCQQAEADSFCKRIALSSDFGYEDLHDKGQRRLSNEHGEELAHLHDDIRGPRHSFSSFKDQSSKVSVGMEKESEGNTVNGSSSDMFDVGISTQIAAEAMEALYYGPPPDCKAADTCEGLENTLTDLQTKSRTHLVLNSPQKVAVCELGEVVKGSKGSIRRRRSARRYNKDVSSSSRNCSYQELSHKTKPKTYKRKQSKVDESVSSNNLKNCETYVSLSISDEQPLLKHLSQEESVIRQSRHSEGGVTLKRIKDQVDKSRVMSTNVKEGSLLTYKRKRKSVVADPPQLLSGEQKCSKLHSYDSAEAFDGKVSEQQQSSPQEAVTARFLRLVTWNCPKGKRAHRKVPIHSNAESNMHASFTSVDAGEHNLDSVRSQKVPKDDEINPSNFNMMGRMRTEPSGPNKHNFGESLRKSIEPSGTECNTALGCQQSVNEASLNNTPYVYQRRPRKRNLPKPSLLKELIGLGVPELISDFTRRDFRTRKELAYVQVLFSQHLDDDVIKQQKKIAARLGISITSCSMDATHFIADKFTRTRNMLEAIALGKPVVTHLWLDSCGQTSCLLDEKNYILRDSKREKEIGFSLAVSLARARQYPLLKEKRVCITQNVKPNKEMITSLVKAVGGEVVKETSQRLAAKDQKIPDDLLILSCEQDRAICTPLLDKGAAVYSSELLLNGIVIQKLEYERHQLFPKFVKEKRKRSQRGIDTRKAQ